MKIFNINLLIAFFIFFMKDSNAQTKDNQVSAKLNHIAVYVTDLEKSEQFYHSLLNLVKIEEPFKDGKHIWFTLGAAGQMHLIKGANKTVEHDKNEHLCFSVASIPDFITKLDKQKIEYSNWPGTAKEPTIRVDGVKQIYFQDPDGHWLEVNDAK
jgi:lactoylglutathione lyase